MTELKEHPIRTKLNKLNKLTAERNELEKQLNRSIALVEWWPKAFEGDMTCRTRWYGSPSRGFRFQALRSDGASKEVSEVDAPAFAGPAPRYNPMTGKVEKDKAGSLT